MKQRRRVDSGKRETEKKKTYKDERHSYQEKTCHLNIGTNPATIPGSKSGQSRPDAETRSALLPSPTPYVSLPIIKLPEPTLLLPPEMPDRERKGRVPKEKEKEEDMSVFPPTPNLQRITHKQDQVPPSLKPCRASNYKTHTNGSPAQPLVPAKTRQDPKYTSLVAAVPFLAPGVCVCVGVRACGS